MFTDYVRYAAQHFSAEADCADAAWWRHFYDSCADLEDTFDASHPAALAVYQPQSFIYADDDMPFGDDIEAAIDDVYMSMAYEISDSYDILIDMYFFIHTIYMPQMDELQDELDSYHDWEDFWVPSAT